MAFLGLCNYYRQFIKEYTKEALPLLRFLENQPSKNAAITFDAPAIKAFNRLKHLLTTTPVLAYPDFSKTSAKMILDCDWSQDRATIGAVLSQPQLHNGKLCERVLAYSSKKLTKAQVMNITLYTIIIPINTFLLFQTRQIILLSKEN